MPDIARSTGEKNAMLVNGQNVRQGVAHQGRKRRFVDV
jgi:hypothetical protein